MSKKTYQILLIGTNPLVLVCHALEAVCRIK